jgi:hypothetical protein
MSKNWLQSEIDVLVASYGAMPYREISEKLGGRSESAIEAKARKLGIVNSRMWSEEEDSVLREHYGQVSAKSICQYINRTPTAIRNRALALGLTAEHLSHDVNFFSVPSLINSYWAGFIAADGCLYNKPAMVTIALKQTDKNHLEAFATDVKYSGRVKIYKSSGSYNSDAAAKIAVCGASKWIEDLNRNFNLTPRKTATLQPPLLTSDLALAFICGLIDGDGSISRCSNQQTLRVGIVGTQAMLMWVKNVMDTYFPQQFNLNRIAQVRTHKMIHEYQISGSRAIQVLSDLSKLPIPHMRRKWDKIESFLQTSPQI